MNCHICKSRLVVLTDVFGRSYCYPHGRQWMEHIAKVVESGDVHAWCEHGGMAGPAAVVVADEGETEVGRHDAATGTGSGNQDGGCCRMEGTKMLVLSRKSGEAIQIGDITVIVNYIKGDKVSLGIDAPKNINIRRSELEPKEVECERL